MKQQQSKLIMGSAIGLAVIAVAIDHTRHSLPTAEPAQVVSGGGMLEQESPCGLDSPCGLGGESPCGLGSESPCGLGDESPCGLGATNPCGLD